MIKNGGKLLLRIAAFATMGLLIAGCSDGSDAKSSVEVRYEVLTTTNHNLNKMKNWTPRATVTMETPTGTSQVTTELPMMNKQGAEGVFADFEPGAPVYISAQKSKYSGDLMCRIYVDDELVSENSTMASFGIATCKGTA